MMTTEEKEAQKEYEEFIAEAGEKRAADSKSAEQKSGEKAELEAALIKLQQDAKDTTKEAYLKEMQIKIFTWNATGSSQPSRSARRRAPARWTRSRVRRQCCRARITRWSRPRSATAIPWFTTDCWASAVALELYLSSSASSESRGLMCLSRSIRRLELSTPASPSPVGHR